MRKSTKFLGALAVAGLVAAGGSAFTSSGLKNNAGPSSFAGGSITQSISGATLENIAYTYTNATNTAVLSVALTFTDNPAIYGKIVTASLPGGTGTALAACSALGAAAALTVTCASDAAGITGATSLVVNVAS